MKFLYKLLLLFDDLMIVIHENYSIALNNRWNIRHNLAETLQKSCFRALVNAYVQSSHTRNRNDFRRDMCASGLFYANKVTNKIWRSANIVTITAVNFSVQITGYRITFRTMNNRFTSIFCETSWLVLINCIWMLWTITLDCYYNYCRSNVSWTQRFDVADRSGKTDDNFMRNVSSIPIFKLLHMS